MVRIAANAAECISQFIAARLRQAKHLRVKRPNHATTTNAGKPEVARFFRQKVDDLDRVIQANVRIAKCSHDLKTRGYTTNAVKAPSRKNGIAVRSNRDGPEIRLPSI